MSYIFQTDLNESLNKHRTEVAIESNEGIVTYQQLDELSEKMACYFSKNILGTNEKVGILVSNKVKCIELMVGLIKEEHVIVPLYPGYPTERLHQMMKKVDLQYLVIDEINENRFTEQSVELDVEKIWRMNQLEEEIGNCENNRKNQKVDENSPLYIHFTSGTTGTPKAVLGSNKGICHYIRWMIKTFDIGQESRVSQFAIQGFDPFLKETLGTLVGGGTVCILEDENIIRDAFRLKDWLNRNRITHIHCVASLFCLMQKAILYSTDFENLNYILLAGEKVNPNDLTSWYNIFGDRVILVNCYGPTETTMSKLYHVICKEDTKLARIPIGKPMGGAQVMILNEKLQLCEPLENGEICIRTPYRSLGYYKDDKLNSEKFISNPYSNEKNDLIYRTGDLGRYLLDGNVEILGRTDRQVKIHGYRIELEEIESTILKYFDNIDEAVVITRSIANSTDLLYGFITLRNKVDSQKEYIVEVKKCLMKLLPQYMVPGEIVILDKIPRNHRGKVDYHVLNEFEINIDSAMDKPKNDVQRQLMKIWIKVFGKEKIGINTSFLEIGGNSLNIMMLISEIANIYKVRIPLGSILKNDTIQKQEQIIRELIAKQTHIEKIVQYDNTPEKQVYNCSYEQMSIWALSNIQNHSSFNIPVKLELRGKLDIDACQKTVNEIISRHTILRTSFFDERGIVKQRIREKANFVFELIDISYLKNEAKYAKLDSYIDEKLKYEFDLENELLIKGTIFTLEEEHYVLFLNIYHIIFDGYSMGIFANEFTKLYNAYIEGEIPQVNSKIVQYYEYVNEQRDGIKNGKYEERKRYWLKQLEKPLPQFSMIHEKKSEGRDAYEAGIFEFMIDQSRWYKIVGCAKELGCTKATFLLAAFFALLYKLFYNEDIIVGVPFNGRTEDKYKNVIGFFVNTLPIRVKFNEVSSFSDLVSIISNLCMDGIEHNYPFDKLVSDINPIRNLDGTPIISTVFIYHNKIININMKNIEVDIRESLAKYAKYNFKLDMQEENESFIGRVEYLKNKFNHTTIEAMCNEYLQIIDIMCLDYKQGINKIFGVESLDTEVLGHTRL